MNSVNEILIKIEEILKVELDSTFNEKDLLCSEFGKLVTKIKYGSGKKICICCQDLDLKDVHIAHCRVDYMYDSIVNNKSLNYQYNKFLLLLCEECIVKYDIKNRVQLTIDEKNRREERKSQLRSEKYHQRNKSIQNYVTTKGVHGYATPSQGYWYVYNYMISHTKEALEIKNLPYKEFLEHWYWKAIARYVKYRADNKCKLCNSTKNLNVHHKNYKIKGFEYKSENLQDLICLCEDCHSTHHKIIKIE